MKSLIVFAILLLATGTDLFAGPGLNTTDFKMNGYIQKLERCHEGDGGRRYWLKIYLITNNDELVVVGSPVMEKDGYNECPECDYAMYIEMYNTLIIAKNKKKKISLEGECMNGIFCFKKVEVMKLKYCFALYVLHWTILKL